MDLFRLWKFTPYLQAGTGVYFTKLTGTVNPFPYTIPNPAFDRTRFSLGVNGGLGIKARLGSHEFFVEQMLHAFDVRRIDTGVYPFNFGIRF